LQRNENQRREIICRVLVRAGSEQLVFPGAPPSNKGKCGQTVKE